MAQSRRGFLKTLLAAFAGSAIVHRVSPAEINPSWLSAQPLPPSDGVALDWWSQIGDEALRILESELSCMKIMSCDPHDSYGSPRLGTSIHIREPLRFVARADPDWGNMKDLIRETIHPVVLDHHQTTQATLPNDFARLTLPQFSDRILQPAMVRLADSIFAESRGSELIVTAPLKPLPANGILPTYINASTVSSSDKLNLRAMYIQESEMPQSNPVVFFDILWGGLRSAS